jgi:hypothetical protein
MPIGRGIPCIIPGTIPGIGPRGGIEEGMCGVWIAGGRVAGAVIGAVGAALMTGVVTWLTAGWDTTGVEIFTASATGTALTLLCIGSF